MKLQLAVIMYSLCVISVVSNGVFEWYSLPVQMLDSCTLTGSKPGYEESKLRPESGSKMTKAVGNCREINNYDDNSLRRQLPQWVKIWEILVKVTYSRNREHPKTIVESRMSFSLIQRESLNPSLSLKLLEGPDAKASKFKIN